MSSIAATPGGHWHGWPTWHRSIASRPARHCGPRTPPAMVAGERILTRAHRAGVTQGDSAWAGCAVVGTDRALYVRAENTAWRRIAWVDVASAAWSPDAAQTILRLWPNDAGRTSEVRLPTDRRFAAFAAERVLSTQVLCRRVQLTVCHSVTGWACGRWIDVTDRPQAEYP